MSLEGVTGETKRVGKNNFEVRSDGFGTMTDAQVEAYKEARPKVYLHGILDKIIGRIVELEKGAP